MDGEWVGTGGQPPYEEPQSPMEMKPDPSSLMRGYSPGSPGSNMAGSPSMARYVFKVFKQNANL